jgi:prophage DNA circulation protein
VWKGWFAALEDGLPGPIDHPIFGKLRARVLNYKVTALAGIRSGIDVQINFTETRERPDQPAAAEPTSVDLDLAAQDADTAVEAVKVLYPDGKVADALASQAAIVKVLYPVEGSEGTLSDIAAGTTLDNPLTIAQQVNRATEIMRGYHDALRLADDPEIWAAIDAVQTCIQSVRVEANRALTNARPTKLFLTPNDTTLDAAAVLLKRDLDDLINLNPGLLSAPFVPAQSKIVYYAQV